MYKVLYIVLLRLLNKYILNTMNCKTKQKKNKRATRLNTIKDYVERMFSDKVEDLDKAFTLKMFFYQKKHIYSA